MGPKQKRRRNIRDVGTRRADDEGDVYSEDMEEDDDDETKGKSSGDKKNSSGTADDDRVWVQCNNCDKWRALPSTVDVDALPDIWTW